MKDFIEITKSGNIRALINKEDIISITESADKQSIEIKLKSMANATLDISMTYEEFKKELDES